MRAYIISLVAFLLSMFGLLHASNSTAQPASAVSGIGAGLVLKDNNVVVNELLPNNTAIQSGLKVGDVIVQVNDVKVTGMKLADVVGLVRGPAGTVVTITIAKSAESELHTFSMTRGIIQNIPTIKAETAAVLQDTQKSGNLQNSDPSTWLKVVEMFDQQ